MNKYRIKKVKDQISSRYYPQVKVLFWWENLIPHSPYNGDGGFSTLAEAENAICFRIRKNKVEYFDFDPNENCK